MKTIVTQLADQIGIQQACEELAYPRSRYYRQLGTTTPHTANRQPAVSHRALSVTERETVRETLNSERFVDSSPRQGNRIFPFFAYHRRLETVVCHKKYAKAH